MSVLMTPRSPAYGRRSVIPPIRIAAPIDGDATAALSALGCVQGLADHHDVWFAEADPVTTGASLPLLQNNLVIRLRTGQSDDVTVALRSHPDTTFAGPWRQSFGSGDFSYRVRGDWCGSRRHLTAAATSHRAPGAIAAAVADGADPARLLDQFQRQFIVACMPSGVSMDRLSLLGPVSSTTWHARIADTRTVRLRRFRFAGLDTVELSTMLQARPGESADRFAARAAALRTRIDGALARVDLVTHADGITSTEHTLAALRTAPLR